MEMAKAFKKAWKSYSKKEKAMFITYLWLFVPLGLLFYALIKIRRSGKHERNA